MRIYVILYLQKRKVPFFDSLRIYVRGGAGGQGLPRYGGIGGKGGDVIIRASKRVKLKDLPEVNPTQRYTAQTGTNSSYVVVVLFLFF